jgi:hypothetical protein
VSCFSHCSQPDSVSLEADRNERIDIFRLWIVFNYDSGIQFNSNEVVFSHCSHFKRINIPSSIKVSGASCFQNCKTLKEVYLEDDSQLKRIEEFAFASSALTTLTLPLKLTHIAGSAVLHSPITELIIQLDSFQCCDLFLQTISGGSAIRHSGDLNLTMPPSLTQIKRSCFAGCHQLTSVIWPPGSDVTCIGQSARFLQT